jgi:hypothetical protein
MQIPENAVYARAELVFTEEQRENTLALIRVSFDPDRNVNEKTAGRGEKSWGSRSYTRQAREVTGQAHMKFADHERYEHEIRFSASPDEVLDSCPYHFQSPGK